MNDIEIKRETINEVVKIIEDRINISKKILRKVTPKKKFG